MTDLEKNRHRQRTITRELELLQQEETLLTSILSLADHPAGAEPSTVPEQAQDESAAADSGAPLPVTGTLSPAADRTGKPQKASTGQNASGGKKRGGRQEPLRKLLLDLLRHHGEPLLAAELREELLEKYPDRNPTPQVVRNTLEASVAKGQIQRHRQQRSVLYTLVDAGDDHPEGSSGPGVPETSN
ncbi:hypothetical protein [Streptomyces sp. NPDC057694]|uniref:hypothetical protein n=1 Tax=Streptomyces sp. NPDC057694 TaxID=3346216 RepID=UPI0036840A7F